MVLSDMCLHIAINIRNLCATSVLCLYHNTLKVCYVMLLINRQNIYILGNMSFPCAAKLEDTASTPSHSSHIRMGV